MEEGIFMYKYRKKPVEVEAVQFDGKTESIEWISQQLSVDARLLKSSERLIIETSKGIKKVAIGDYIIKDINGELNTCKPDIFQKTYEADEKTPCHSYQVGQRGKYIFNPVTGKNEYTLVSYGFCLGTKECEECSCEGDKSRCNFY